MCRYEGRMGMRRCSLPLPPGGEGGGEGGNVGSSDAKLRQPMSHVSPSPFPLPPGGRGGMVLGVLTCAAATGGSSLARAGVGVGSAGGLAEEEPHPAVVFGFGRDLSAQGGHLLG